MRVAQRPLRRHQVAQTVSVSAPVAGWNARDPIQKMKPEDAVILDNIFCSPYDVSVRRGYSEWATGMTGTVNSVCSYSPPSGNQKLFAAVGEYIYDVSSSGAVGAAAVSGLTSDKFQHVNFGTSGGNYMYMVNGVDKPQLYDGSSWVAVDGVSTPAITGVTTTNLINVCVHQSRLWFVEKSSMKVWYLATSSIGGAATSINFSSLFNRGGYLVAMGSWSLDAGYGMDDYAVFVTSEGQIAVYKGNDPSSAATWALIGVYDIGAPIGRRCFMKYAGDLTIVSRDGLLPLSKSLMSSRVNSRETLTDRIQHVMGEYAVTYGANFGWEAALFPQESMLMINVPISSSVSYQLVMNTTSGAWCRFKGWNAACLELHNDLLYFGGDGVVCKAWDTYADNGTNIEFEGQQSFSYFGNAGQLKQIKMLRPIISTDGETGILIGVNTDFDTTAPAGTPTFSPSTASVWDSATWDSAVFGGDLSIKKEWQTAFGLGFCFAAHIKGAVNGKQLRWASTDYLVQGGGVV